MEAKKSIRSQMTPGTTRSNVPVNTATPVMMEMPIMHPQGE